MNNVLRSASKLYYLCFGARRQIVHCGVRVCGNSDHVINSMLKPRKKAFSFTVVVVCSECLQRPPQLELSNARVRVSLGNEQVHPTAT